MPEPLPKPVTYRDHNYLDWMRGQPCVMCGKHGEPHHVRRLYWGAGVSHKPHDYCTISLCREHHDPKHEANLNIERLIISYLMKYIHETLLSTPPEARLSKNRAKF